MKNPLQFIKESEMKSKNKFDLALCFLVEKRKVAWLDDSKVVETVQQKKEFMEKFAREIKEIEKVLDKLGFNYESSGLETEEHEEELATVSFSVLVSKSEKYLTEFVEANRRGLDERIGLLLGYPQTAVEAFEADKTLNFEVFFRGLSRKKRKNLRKEGILNFLGFQPSEQHWREELEEVRKIQDLVKERAPGLYKEIIETEINFADLPLSRIERFWSWIERR